MKKKIKKPFDVETAKEGAIIETVDGHSVRILCYDRKGPNFPIIALINHDGIESCFSYTAEGKMLDNGLFDNYQGEHDLVIIEEIEVPKFNVKDWLVAYNEDLPRLITAVTPDCYELEDVKGHKVNICHRTIENLCRLWTLKDAKPGDVLVDVLGHPFIYKSTGVVHFPAFPVAYCGITEEGDFEVAEEDDYWTDTRVKPATKEQRDRLFEKMEKAGYIWEAESLTLFKVLKRGIEVLITKIILL